MKAGGCKTEFKVGVQLAILHITFVLTQYTDTQDWSKCVDDERKQDKDFTEECQEKVCMHVCKAGSLM